MALFQIKKLSDDKYLAFIMTHFLLIMSYQWYGVIKANLHHVVPRDLFYFTSNTDPSTRDCIGTVHTKYNSDRKTVKAQNMYNIGAGIFLFCAIR